MQDSLPQALTGLTQLVDARVAPGTALGNWRWTVRQRLTAVREELANETATSRDGWLIAREGSVLRERSALMTRLSVLSPMVLQTEDIATLRSDLKRLIGDISRHLQRLRDIAYDEVEIELGGSE